jgi:hypothetical protein
MEILRHRSVADGWLSAAAHCRAEVIRWLRAVWDWLRAAWRRYLDEPDG